MNESDIWVREKAKDLLLTFRYRHVDAENGDGWLMPVSCPIDAGGLKAYFPQGGGQARMSTTKFKGDRWLQRRRRGKRDGLDGRRVSKFLEEVKVPLLFSLTEAARGATVLAHGACVLAEA